MEPVRTLLRRVSEELGAEFAPTRPIRVSRAPGRLDVMGGIADYTGSLVAEATLDRAAAVALQPRPDRLVQVFSFNLFDDGLPFTFGIPLDALATTPLEKLRVEFSEPGRRWAAYLAGCLFLLHECKLVDLLDPKWTGINLALYSNIPLGAGVSSSAAVEVATMINLMDHFGVRDQVDPMMLSSLCQQVENRIVGAPCGIMDQVSACYGEAGSLMRLKCQPHEIQPALFLPPGTRMIGINSNVRHSVGGGQYGRTRCAAFMGHKIILHRMGAMGKAAGRELIADPMNGYLANLEPDDYKTLFRQHVPEEISGQEFLNRYGPTIDTATTISPLIRYHVQRATDHHVLEARRVQRFVEFLSEAATANGAQRKLLLDKAGHLMYGSHLSYTNDAMLGAPECDLLVQLVREREWAGLYGAKITGGGSGGTVGILAEYSTSVDAAISEIMTIYEQKTGKKPEAFVGTSPGAWHVGTALVER
jgi:L-arabinokinase